MAVIFYWHLLDKGARVVNAWMWVSVYLKMNQFKYIKAKKVPL